MWISRSSTKSEYARDMFDDNTCHNCPSLLQLCMESLCCWDTIVLYDVIAADLRYSVRRAPDNYNDYNGAQPADGGRGRPIVLDEPEPERPRLKDAWGNSPWGEMSSRTYTADRSPPHEFSRSRPPEQSRHNQGYIEYSEAAVQSQNGHYHPSHNQPVSRYIGYSYRSTTCLRIVSIECLLDIAPSKQSRTATTLAMSTTLNQP